MLFDETTYNSTQKGSLWSPVGIEMCKRGNYVTKSAMAQPDVFPIDVEFAHPKDSLSIHSETSDDFLLSCSSILDCAYVNDSTFPFESEIVFPGLPKLLSGHTDIHLREGIIRAFADNAPNSERAFFAADLSQVYAQHARWVRNLPDVEPFFGAIHHL